MSVRPSVQQLVRLFVTFSNCKKTVLLPLPNRLRLGCRNSGIDLSLPAFSLRKNRFSLRDKHHLAKSAAPKQKRLHHSGLSHFKELLKPFRMRPMQSGVCSLIRLGVVLSHSSCLALRMNNFFTSMVKDSVTYLILATFSDNCH